MSAVARSELRAVICWNRVPLMPITSRNYLRLPRTRGENRRTRPHRRIQAPPNISSTGTSTVYCYCQLFLDISRTCISIVVLRTNLRPSRSLRAFAVWRELPEPKPRRGNPIAASGRCGKKHFRSNISFPIDAGCLWPDKLTMWRRHFLREYSRVVSCMTSGY